MSLSRPALWSLTLPVVALLAAACGADGVVADCFAPDDGRLAPTPCVAPFGATVEPTPTATPSGGDGNGDGDGADGLSVFLASGCTVCHTIDSVPRARGLTGPNLTTVGTNGADYIRQSIVSPNEVIVEGFPSDVMPQNFADLLAADELDALVAYLSSLQ